LNEIKPNSAFIHGAFRNTETKPDPVPLQLSQTKELESIAGNAMNVRAAAAAWICAFHVVNLPEWAKLAARRTN